MIPRLLMVLGVVLTAAGCTSNDRTPIVVYSPHGKEMLSECERLYEQSHPGHDVRWLDMGSQDALDRIRTERSNPQADVWWGAPMTAFAAAERESLLERYVPTWEHAVPRACKSQGGYWYGTFVTPEVIMTNTRVVPESEAPRDWDDLLDPRWRGKIIIRSPLASGTMRIVFSALMMREERRAGSVEAGMEWLRRLDANTKTYVADPTQLYLKLAREEGMISIWNLPDVMIQRQTNNYPFGYVLPRSGTPLITDCIALVRGAPHSAAAREFYEFVTSQENLIFQAERFWRIPAREDIPPERIPAWMTSLTVTPMPIDWEELASREQELMKLWDERVKGHGRARAGG